MLDAWHPGLIEKMDAMFAEFWPAAEIRQMVQAQYGERLSLSAIEKYKSKHWRARRELVQQMSQAIGASAHRFIEPSEDQQLRESIYQWADQPMNRFERGV
jgi:hypothetical protein